VLRGSISREHKSIRLNIDSYFAAKYNSQNVAAYVRGREVNDTFIVVTAHYDHLGMIGTKVLFPGANDNASGVAMMLSLARHFSQPDQTPRYSVAFIAFGAEEAGLLGSKYYVDNPLFSLNRVKFVVNLDLVGTGEEGITVVNATEYPERFRVLDSLNRNGDYVLKVNQRGKAANSDHYYFSEAGVPAFFIYAMGGIQAYHDVFDRAETLPLTEFEDLTKLIAEFIENIQ
jgi:aminopeptidase YwaD